MDRVKRRTIDADQLERLRRDYDVIPIVREFSADAITPVSAFASLSSGGDEAFLLESVERGESVGRYSFVGSAPRRRLALRPTDSPLETLRRELRPLRVFEEETLPPFFGGAVGYFGYNAARWTERLPVRHAAEHELPDATLLFFDTVVAFDHVRQTLFVVSNIIASDRGSSRQLLVRAHDAIQTTITALTRKTPEMVEHSEPADVRFEAIVSKSEFVEMVREAREQIAAGEIFQVVLSQRWECDYPEQEALALYRSLRRVNPSPYMFLLRTSECTLVGASPELLARSTKRDAELRPIAGTRPRGKTIANDEALEQELLDDAKENAEHLMLVDLARNDLSRVCDSGSVNVTSFRSIEKYSHVMHLVSRVSGSLRSDTPAVDLLLAAFPAGTVSGAPKIRAMEIIDGLEQHPRGVYAGAVVYFGYSGSLDSCIAIRTIVLRDGRALIQAGAGVVFDSDPEREYEETRQKAAASMHAVAAAIGTLDSTRALLEVAR